ncbi:vegetative cell wall protein gp1-like [Panicum virgatum]|uniref:vegetative cell wall protein gp1-like n=1 Tax=Panicum virgatum TaxID=38727 RepID=UPI0019D50F6F|nr:vegetative cell wall protein gp1-like [Panicum virgatum]
MAHATHPPLSTLPQPQPPLPLPPPNLPTAPPPARHRPLPHHPPGTARREPATTPLPPPPAAWLKPSSAPNPRHHRPAVPAYPIPGAHAAADRPGGAGAILLGERRDPSVGVSEMTPAEALRRCTSGRASPAS